MKVQKENVNVRSQNLILIPVLIIGLALLPKVQAVNPPPDGGYPNFTTAEGANALSSLTTGSANTAVGFFSLFANTTGSFNTAVGAGALDLNTADNNTATGAAALLLNTTGTDNTANGVDALALNESGSQNTATGAFALFNNTIGEQNTAIGREALFNNSTGNFNTAIGHNTLFNNTSGSNNVVLGNGAGGGITTVNGVICIGSLGANVGSSCFIGQIRGKTTHNANALPVVIDSADQLGTLSSSRRFKKEITPMDKASEAILDLNPVTFHYKSDETNTPQYGLIAEEVAEINPDLVVRDDKGEIYTVRYDAVSAMLLNEFLKDHRRVQEQKRTISQQREEFDAAIARQRKDFESTISELKKGIETVTVRLNEQAAQMQKVNARIEVSTSVAEMAPSNP
jgi:hypothetical protein